MSVTQQVENYLRDHRQARNSDRYLIALFLRDSDLGLTKEQIIKLIDFTSFETIRRTRQKIQQGGKYPADGEVKKERNKREQEMQQNMPTAKPERIEQILEDGSKVVVPKNYRIVE